MSQAPQHVVPRTTLETPVLKFCFLAINQDFQAPCLIDDRIPYTSHNSSACAIIDLPDPFLMTELISKAVDHIEQESTEGSDPGLCVVRENDPVLSHLMSFGRSCTARVMTQQEILQAANGTHISGHGGTNDGIIGAAAAVGLTVSGSRCYVKILRTFFIDVQEIIPYTYPIKNVLLIKQLVS